MSRSRSRVPMDWRPSSRSRSRPPLSITEQQNQFKFPNMSPPKNLSLSSRPIPVSSSSGRRSPTNAGLAAVYESNAEHSSYVDLPSFAALTSPVGYPSSLPSHGLYGLPRTSVSHLPSTEQRTFPKHVRKTSFDHTVAREGFFNGISGRHQVNGRPLPPDKLLGIKRRADAPHAESMLRGDPILVDGGVSLDNQDVERGSPFPSSSFNFSFPHFDNHNFMDMPGHGHLATHPMSQSLGHTPKGRLSEGHFHDPMRASLHGTFSPADHGSEGLSAAAAAASAAVAESYAQLNLAGLDDTGLDYSLMGMGIGMYHNLDGNGSLVHQPFTHIDPTQILPADHGDGPFQSFHPSPSSDGWGNGLNSSSNASPEPYITSNASTPPSVEGAPNGNAPARAVSRKIVTSKRSDGTARAAQRKGYVHVRFLVMMMVKLLTCSLRSCRSTPELTAGGSSQAGKEDGEGSPTVCTNCSTTNTPLWRRDPEGQPLCKCQCFSKMPMSDPFPSRQRLWIILCELTCPP